MKNLIQDYHLLKMRISTAKSLLPKVKTVKEKIPRSSKQLRPLNSDPEAEISKPEIQQIQG